MDCLEGMKYIDNKSIDMILCDLPYGTTQNKWDSIIPLDKLWEQYKRIIKDNGAVVLFAQTPFDKVLGCSNLEWLRYEWIWQKSKPTGHLNARKMPLKEHENILVFYKNLPPYNYLKFCIRRNKPLKMTRNVKGQSSNYGFERKDTIHDLTNFPKSIIQFNIEKGLHPTQKPVALCEYLINLYTNEDSLVLDNCIGSGTTAIACINTGRNFIGFEINKHYCEIANERIRNALAKKEVSK